MTEQSASPPQPPGSLKQFERLVGEWSMVGTHPQVSAAVNGHSSFEWFREGALLLWHFNWEGVFPNALSVIGRDDALEPCTMLYTDVRGVSRIYQMSLDGAIWKMWRASPGFSQRTHGLISADGNTITVRGELSHDGSTWEPDLDVIYTRKR